MRVFIGLDVSLAKTAICVVDRDGAVQWQGKVPSEPGALIKRLAEWSDIIELAGIEACPLSEWLHRGLREAGIPAVCIETRHAQRFLSSGSQTIADLGLCRCAPAAGSFRGSGKRKRPARSVHLRTRHH